MVWLCKQNTIQHSNAKVMGDVEGYAVPDVTRVEPRSPLSYREEATCDADNCVTLWWCTVPDFYVEMVYTLHTA